MAEWLRLCAGGLHESSLSAAPVGGGAIADANARPCQGRRRSGLFANLATHGEQHPKQAISVPKSGTLHGALEHRQLLAERQVLDRDRSESSADQRGGAQPA